MDDARGKSCRLFDRGNMVSWTPDDRRELAELCREHDRIMREAAEDERRREETAVVYKTYDNNPVELSRAPSEELSDETIGCIADAVFDLEQRITRRLEQVRCEYDQQLAKRDVQIDVLQQQNAELRGRLDIMVQLMARQLFAGAEPHAKSGEVIELPDWRRSCDVA